MYKIMLADDEGIVLDSLKFILTKAFGEQIHIETAKTGRSVIELAERFRPDIAIMDIQMPGINGIEAMREIRLTNSGVVFIVMSAYDKFDYAKEAINLGVLDYLNKPVDKQKILDVVKRAMERIDGERARRSQDLMIREKMETVVPILENGLVFNLLFREYFTEDIESYKSLLGLTSPYGYMIALVFGQGQEGAHMTNATESSIEVQNHFRQVSEIIKEYFAGYVGTVMANKIAVLVPMDHIKTEYGERIDMIEKGRAMARKLRERVGITFRVGFGTVRELSEAMESYNEAIDSLTLSTGSVAHSDDLPVGCGYEENYPVELERTLFERVEKGDLNGANAAAGQFFDWMMENHSQHGMDVKLKVLEFVLWAEHLAYQYSGRVYRFLSRNDYLPVVYETTDWGELRTWFLDKIEQACRNVRTRKEDQSTTIIERAKKYMETHYQKDISLDDVSREVDISPYYFSKVFKEETGENFIEYLTAIRIAEAKKLLESTNLSMKEICARIGYADPNYFSRSFKKNVGVTPTEYKEGGSV